MGQTLTETAALVLFSGGQDSTTVLAWALARYDRVETIGFAYGQKHSVELEQRPIIRDLLQKKFSTWRGRLGADHIVNLDIVGQIAANIPVYNSDKSSPVGIVGRRYIPGRNLIMLSMSASVAFRRSIPVLACGTSETEYSGYPDCRRKAMKAIELAVRESSGMAFTVEAPLMELDKAGVWQLAHSLGGDVLVELIREETHTCYIGKRVELHEWGYGCGECDACRLRKKGWSEFLERRTGVAS